MPKGENRIRDRSNFPTVPNHSLLKVVAFDHMSPTRGLKWKCVCRCGNERIVGTSALQSGATYSCGCVRRKPKRGLGEVSSKRLYQKYKVNARRGGREFRLPFDKFLGLTKRSCFYCGVEPKAVFPDVYFKGGGHRVSGGGHYVYNGIDRLDNDLGYTEENSVPCCSRCNWAKRDLSLSEFLDMVNRIHARFSSGLTVRKGG